MTMIDFLEARIAEDESFAMMDKFEVHWTGSDTRQHFLSRVQAESFARRSSKPSTIKLVPRADGPRSAARRILDECEAKRAIIYECYAILCDEWRQTGDDAAGLAITVLRRMIIPYASHPDCDAKWVPTRAPRA
jgi:hypothetical protein